MTVAIGDSELIRLTRRWMSKISTLLRLFRTVKLCRRKAAIPQRLAPDMATIMVKNERKILPWVIGREMAP